jgi:hypothetical protein
MNILKANGVELAFDSFGDETAEPILLIAGLGMQMIRWTVHGRGGIYWRRRRGAASAGRKRPYIQLGLGVRANYTRSLTGVNR